MYSTTYVCIDTQEHAILYNLPSTPIIVVYTWN